MAVSSYVGLFGHGKTYGVIENVVIPAIKNNRRVYTNIKLNMEEWLKQFGTSPVYFHIDEIKQNPDWFQEVFEPGAVLVIDECWNLWPSGETLRHAKDQHKSFVQEHRHMVGEDGIATDIVIIASDNTILASWIRSALEQTFRMTKLKAVGANKSFRVDVYSGAVVGHTPPKSRLVNTFFGTYKDEVTRLYKSQTKSLVDSHGKELIVDKRFTIFTARFFIVRLVFPIVAILTACVLVYRILVPKREQTEPVIPVKTAEVQYTNGDQATVSRANTRISLPQHVEFLSKVDFIYISGNRGIYPDIDYVFRAVTGEMYSVLGRRELSKLGYKIEPVSECSVKVTGHDFNEVVGCRVPEPIQRDSGPVDPFTEVKT